MPALVISTHKSAQDFKRRLPSLLAHARALSTSRMSVQDFKTCLPAKLAHVRVLRTLKDACPRY